MGLADYKDLVAAAASITTIAQFFSGVFICKDIVKKGNTHNISAVPFLGGAGMGVLMLQYSQMLDDPAMTRVNIVGFVLNLLYLICYYIYSQEKKDVQGQVFYMTVFVSSLIAYTYWEATEVVEFRYGFILTVLMMLLIASPLFSLGEIIRTKSTETLPFPLIISATVVTFLWLLYGIIIENEFIQSLVVKQMLAVVTTFTILMCYTQYETDFETVKFYVGFVASLMTILFFAAPLTMLAHVLNVKSVESLPFPMISMTFVCSALWLIYGYMLGDPFIQ
ncbi:hypothetical protein L9F63_017180, partial [Diploptera punctata]